MIMTGADEAEVWPLVRDFHYSERMSAAVRHAFALRKPGGLFGDTGEVVAAITYSQPVNRNFPPEAVELSRLVRREDHSGQLSQFVAWSLRWLKAHTDIPFVLSYADSTQGHHGGIYQACNFKYVGEMASGHIGYSAPDGSFVHRRTCNARFGTSSTVELARIKPDWVAVHGEPKHLYIFPLRQKWKRLAEQQGWQETPYPKPHYERAVANG